MSQPAVPRLRLQELVERHPAGQVVDDADESGEHALGNELQEFGIGQTRVVGAPDHIVGDLAALCCDIAREGVDGRVNGVVRLAAGAHRVDVGLVDAERAEHGGVERDAVGVVDSYADCHAGDLAVHRSERRV